MIYKILAWLSIIIMFMAGLYFFYDVGRCVSAYGDIKLYHSTAIILGMIYFSTRGYKK